MIPFIRSLAELMSITESRDGQKHFSFQNESYNSTIDSGQRKRYIRSLENNEVRLPFLPKTKRGKSIKNKEYLSRFIDNLDYNNQRQSSYDLTLIERQKKKTQQDVA